jgi:hypothetical protein
MSTKIVTSIVITPCFSIINLHVSFLYCMFFCPISALRFPQSHSIEEALFPYFLRMKKIMLQPWILLSLLIMAMNRKTKCSNSLYYFMIDLCDPCPYASTGSLSGIRNVTQNDSALMEQTKRKLSSRNVAYRMPESNLGQATEFPDGGFPWFF